MMANVERNEWCQVLGIENPRLEDVKDHKDMVTYSLMIVALLEKGEPMTLEEVAVRFEEVGKFAKGTALSSLKRCRPARAPIYKTGDYYSLDPHNRELELWVFRLGLREAKFAHVKLVENQEIEIASPDVPLTTDELATAWAGITLYSSWSIQRIVMAVLDAHGTSLFPEFIIQYVNGINKWHGLATADFSLFKRKGSAIDILEDGRFAIREDAEARLIATRKAVRKRLEVVKRSQYPRFDPVLFEQREKILEREKQQKREALRKMSRVLLVGYPKDQPRIVLTLDVKTKQINAYFDADFEVLQERLEHYGMIGADNVRHLLNELQFKYGTKRLAELGPPQKTITVADNGKTIELTTELLIRCSCAITTPFANTKTLDKYIQQNNLAAAATLLEKDLHSIYALYQYELLHGAVRVRWRTFDELLPMAWVPTEEQRLYGMMLEAAELGLPLQVVVNRVGNWYEPWSNILLAYPYQPPGEWQHWLYDADGRFIDEADILFARMVL